MAAKSKVYSVITHGTLGAWLVTNRHITNRGRGGYNTRHIGHDWPISTTTVIAIMAKAHEKIRAWWKYLISLFKSDWNLSDYPIRVSQQNIDPDYVGTRLKQYKYSAQIVNWWVVSGSGDTEEEALQDLQKHFSSTKAERAKSGKKLPRPGTHVEIEFASRERVGAHPELAEDFVRRVLELDWALITDESSLWDFHSSEDNNDLILKIKEVYGVDVSDIESAKLWQILERIAASQSRR